MNTNEISLLVLGSGTSTGVPMIGCDCDTCSSDDPRDRRTRASALISWLEGSDIRNVLVDTSTDLRQQSLNAALNHIDSVLFTHPHADHIHGIDELRSFNFLQKNSIPCYGSPYTLSRIRTMFDYIFSDEVQLSAIPKITLEPMEGDFTIFGRKIVPLAARHGEMDIYGYRIGSIAYLTDCNLVPDSTLEKMQRLSLLVIGAVQTKRHPTHFNIDQAVKLSRTVGAEKTYITHLNHSIRHENQNAELPDNVWLAYDGLRETVVC
ncbi:MAG: MBL fold metallo-hydrolase [Nitrospinota bacterium]